MAAEARTVENARRLTARPRSVDGSVLIQKPRAPAGSGTAVSQLLDTGASAACTGIAVSFRFFDRARKCAGASSLPRALL